MPCAARFVNTSTSPNHIWPRAWSGTDDRALVSFASAPAEDRRGISYEEISTQIALAGAAQGAETVKHERVKPDVAVAPLVGLVLVGQRSRAIASNASTLIAIRIIYGG
jgi:hypothetical protein